MPGTSLLEKERNRYYLVLVSRETGFPGKFVGRTRQVKGEGLGVIRSSRRRIFTKTVYMLKIRYTKVECELESKPKLDIDEVVLG
jgi:hypothetical protein